MRTRALLLAACAALGCATARAPGPGAPRTDARGPAAAAAAAAVITPGLAAAEVRRRLGDPQRVEHVRSSASPGASYDRWRYPDREVVLLDGRVIDVVP
ncbi:hypothetical protein [Anaeromyxobacter diazotrophicus]|uniref:Lipoprotein n=1 Tax=Anaeromyxobacter diazotrophicus TaxID=2590199 RepID=A0A7I9VJI4_9BACT|nr:hypothetical protein [Anaeromyxobacter diazotrophicus]GEJ56349.1 hypothetical protein AMYX_10900 [Anaeromyxobacter diazotrophicus]